MFVEPPVFLALDLAGTFVFALNGSLTALRATRLDVVGVVTLGVITAVGGGLVRDVLIGAVPPATFLDWRYLMLAFTGALIAFGLSTQLGRADVAITVFDAVGLSVFAVIGTRKALEFGLGSFPALLLGVVTAVGGGTIRDALVGQVPSVMTRELYAIPALVAGAVTIASRFAGLSGAVWAYAAAALCFVIRMAGVHFGINAPGPPGQRDTDIDPGEKL